MFCLRIPIVNNLQSPPMNQKYNLRKFTNSEITNSIKKNT